MGFCLFCWLLESSFACSSALVSLWHHGFSVNIGFFLAIKAWKCCAHVLSSGRFSFVSVIAVSLDSCLLYTSDAADE